MLAFGLTIAQPLVPDAVPSAAAAAERERQRLRYQIEVAGVEVGRIEVEAERNAEAAEARLEWDMDGLLGLIPREEGTLEGRSRIDGRGGVAPASFASRSEKRKREYVVEIRYAPDGGIADLRLARNGRERRTEVPRALREDTVDTLTAFWRLRRWLAARRPGTSSGGNGNAEIAVFDGRRRYDLLARTLGRERVEVDGREVEAERIEMRLIPRAGFDDDGEVFGSRIDPDEPWAEALVSVGEDPIPLVLTGQGRLPWRIELERG